jgi:4-hydroxy 2-oxovalerate aldolase
LVRIVYHPTWHDRAIGLASTAAEAGLKTSLNIALASHYQVGQLRDLILQLAEADPDIIYVADTCANLMPDDVEAIFANLEIPNIGLGFHAHDFLSLALANSMAAAANGAKYIDASMWGIGRGAGNLRLELWLALHRLARGRGSLESIRNGLRIVEEKVGRPKVPDLPAIISGALNLTPPQEERLRRGPSTKYDDQTARAAAFFDLCCAGASVDDGLTEVSAAQ